jgi:arylsulfatase A-like enzyme
MKSQLITGSLLVLSTLQAKEKPNIMWIITEDLSPLFGCYGEPSAHTPFLDSLAKKSITYTNVYTVAPISAPSRSCLVSGMYSTSLGTPHLRQEQTIPDWFRCFPEYLNEAGYYTSLRNKTDFNFPPDGIFSDLKSDGKDLWQKRKKGQPFFVYRNTGSTHEGPGNTPELYKRSTARLPENRYADPKTIVLPPYYPDTEEMRRIYARYYDLAASFDMDVEDVFKQLEEDKLLDNTIVFIFSDHGTGLPRYKRWLNITGTHIPLIVYLPEKFRHLSKNKPGEINSNLISSIDFAPTVLNLAGVKLPSHLQGQPFLGEKIPVNRTFAFASRDRADDMYEVSRAVITNRYIYIRHFLPYLPYIQSGVIYNNDKSSFRELRRVHAENPDAQGKELWNRKPVEEMYDLLNDPQETQNVANHPAYSNIKNELKNTLHNHLLNIRDAAILPEPEMMKRSIGSTTYEMALNEAYNLPDILAAAERVGFGSLEDFIQGLKHEDSGVRYWSVIGIRNLESGGQSAVSELLPLLNDESPVCQMAAAEVIARLGLPEKALPVLQRWLEDDKLWNKLYAARTLEQIAPLSYPLNDVMDKQIEALSQKTENGGRRYNDFNFCAFTGWALESALQKNGYTIKFSPTLTWQ